MFIESSSLCPKSSLKIPKGGQRLFALSITSYPYSKTKSQDLVDNQLKSRINAKAHENYVNLKSAVESFSEFDRQLKTTL